MESLYVCLFSNGHIKVGRSVNPAARIASHADRVACIGVKLEKSKVEPCVGDVVMAEADLIARCAAFASARNKSEWFEGVGFDDACAWMTQSANKHYPKPTPRIVPEKPATNVIPFDDSKRRYQCRWDEQGHYWIDNQPDKPHWPESDMMRWDLRPKDWHQIWPELIDHPCAVFFAPFHPNRKGPKRFVDWVKSWPIGFDASSLIATMPEQAVVIFNSIWPELDRRATDKAA